MTPDELSPLAADEIRRQGWKIEGGPFFNTNLFAKKGVMMWSIKTTLSKEELLHHGIKIPKKGGKPPGTRRTVRFVATLREDGSLDLKHITTAGRRKVGRGRKRSRAAAKE
jgi:hypothetical protein